MFGARRVPKGNRVMTSLRGWIIASWAAFPGVMLGGTLLLRPVALGDPSDFQVTWLRAFHAHGGVLFVLSLLYFLFLDRTALRASVKRLACVALFIGIGGLAGGFLLQAIIGQPHQASLGMDGDRGCRVDGCRDRRSCLRPDHGTLIILDSFEMKPKPSGVLIGEGFLRTPESRRRSDSASPPG